MICNPAQLAFFARESWVVLYVVFNYHQVDNDKACFLLPSMPFQSSYITIVDCKSGYSVRLDCKSSLTRTTRWFRTSAATGACNRTSQSEPQALVKFLCRCLRRQHQRNAGGCRIQLQESHEDSFCPLARTISQLLCNIQHALSFKSRIWQLAVAPTCRMFGVMPLVWICNHERSKDL